MIYLNSLLNDTHELSQPEQHPLIRMFATRVAGIACTALESLALLFSPVRILSKTFGVVLKGQVTLLSWALPKSEGLKGVQNALPGLRQVCDSWIYLARLIAGLASTLLFGIVLSPELNFRIHLKLKLAVDNLSVKRKKEQRQKLDAARRGEEITKLREIRHQNFIAERDKNWKKEKEEIEICQSISELFLKKNI